MEGQAVPASLCTYLENPSWRSQSTVNSMQYVYTILNIEMRGSNNVTMMQCQS